MVAIVDFDEVLEAAGGAEQLRQGFEDFQRRARLLDAQIVNLIQAHPRQWVAMLPEGDNLVFAASHSELLAWVKAAGAPTSGAVIRFLDPDPTTMIL